MSLPLRDAREIFEREYLMAQINRFGGNISRTAEFVGMERSALHRKLRALGVNSNERTGGPPPPLARSLCATKRLYPLTPAQRGRIGHADAAGEGARSQPLRWRSLSIRIR